MDVPTDELAAVAAAAAKAGGTYLGETFRSGPVAAEYHTDSEGQSPSGRREYLVDDVKADADVAAENRVLAVVEDHFPTHATHGEESGHRGDHEYTWVVDPLDGTNNFASGLPMFATAVTAVRDDDPVAAAVYEPLPDTLYVAERGGGATANGEPISATSDVPLDRGTVSLVVGLPAIRDPDRRERARAIEDALEDRCKRVIQTWSPCVDWGVLAAGSIEGIVCYFPDVYEQYPGELLAAESGVESHAEEGLYVGASDEETLAALLDAVPV